MHHTESQFILLPVKMFIITGSRITYRILFEEVDESEVELLHIVCPDNEGSGYDEYRYPRAGTVCVCLLTHSQKYIIFFTITSFSNWATGQSCGQSTALLKMHSVSVIYSYTVFTYQEVWRGHVLQTKTCSTTLVPGTPNAKCNLKILEFTVDETGMVSISRMDASGPPIKRPPCRPHVVPHQ